MASVSQKCFPFPFLPLLLLLLHVSLSPSHARLTRRQVPNVDGLSDEALIGLFNNGASGGTAGIPGFSPGVMSGEAPPDGAFGIPGLSPALTSGGEAPSVLAPSAGGGECTCVKWWNCQDMTSVPDDPQRENLVGDPRLGTSVTKVDLRQGIMCPGDVNEICCFSPANEVVQPPAPPPHTPSCGRLNLKGIHANFQGFTDQQAQFGQLPWMAALRTVRPRSDDPVYGYLGGGSLVRPGVVMTAAHKVYDRPVEDLVVRLGEWDFSTESETIPHQEIAVQRVALHPQFVRKSLVYNVALLFLEREASLGSTVDTICLPESTDIFDGSMCISSGWGKDSFGEAGKYQEILKTVELPGVNHGLCESAMKSTRLGQSFSLHQTFMCAGGAGPDLCTGDGGSPLVCPSRSDPNRYVQAGISAWGIGCGQPGIPGVYASVVEALPWIKSQLETGISVGFDERFAPFQRR